MRNGASPPNLIFVDDLENLTVGGLFVLNHTPRLPGSQPGYAERLNSKEHNEPVVALLLFEQRWLTQRFLLDFIQSYFSRSMNFKRYNGEPNIQSYQKKASTAFAQGDVMFLDSNGFLDKAGASDAGATIIGVAMETCVSTDAADYASTRYVAVDLASKGDNGDWFQAVVGTGTATQTMVGESHDLTSAGTVDVNATSTLCVKVQKIVSATSVIVCFMDAA